MKKTLCLLLAMIAIRAFACGGYADLYPKWSIGVIGIGNYSMAKNGYQPYFLPGIQFTHTNSNGLWAERAAVEHIKTFSESEVFPQGNDMLAYNGTERRTILRAGIEHGWFLHKLFRPYAALDLAGQLHKSDYTYSGGIAGLNQRDEITTKGIGLLPTIGFKTYIGTRISVFAEYRAEAFLSSVYTDVTYYNGNVDARPYKQTQFDFNVGKIAQAGIQVMF